MARDLGIPSSAAGVTRKEKIEKDGEGRGELERKTEEDEEGGARNQDEEEEDDKDQKLGWR
eukprot:24170-Hanusia_phi.AAC.1